MPEQYVWIVGVGCKGKGEPWDLLGIFDTQGAAELQADSHKNFFVARIEMNRLSARLNIYRTAYFPAKGQTCPIDRQAVVHGA